MNPIRMPSSIVLSCLVALTFCAHPLEAADPLPSWHDTPTKQAIVAFVEKVSDEDSVNYVPPSRRIATFDNDGTLWSEQPMYFQAAFVIDRVKAMAPDHPQWKEQEPFASVLKDDMKGLVAAGKAGLMQLLAATHAGMTVEEFEETVSDWIQTARHPVTGKAYTEMVYHPMLELLDYLRANGFKTFIVSGGGIEFMRPWVEEVYGIAPEQVVGSSLKMKYELRDGVPVLLKLPEIDLVDDKEGKPVGIQSHIGRRPIFAAGNSDGDLQMLEYTTIPRDASDTTPRFGLIVHHTDGEREFAYDRESHFGRLDKALEDAPKRGWVVVDMKADWKQVYRR